MESATTSEGEERVVSWIMASIDGDQSNCFHHISVGHSDHSSCHFNLLFSGWFFPIFLDKVFKCSLYISIVAYSNPLTEFFFVDPFEVEICICCGHIRTFPIGRRTRVRASRLGPNENLFMLCSSNRTSTVANLYNVDYRN
jgi:hypothetical protein